MLRYAVLRTLGAIPTLVLVIGIAFLMVHAAPGGPFSSERVLPADNAQNIADAYRLDESLPQQFTRYLGGVLKGDLGPSYRFRDFTVGELIRQALPVSMQLGAMSMLLALFAGTPIGIYAALRKHTLTDRLLTGLSMTGISVPTFVLAPMMVLVFAVTLNWLPASFSGNTGAGKFVLPVIALALPQIAAIARLTRGSMIEVMQSDYIRTARAQGLKTSSIVRHHALKPSLLPLVSYLGPALAATLTGSVVVEQVFGIPGIGQLFIVGAVNRDYTLVLGITIFYAALVIFLNLLVDLLYGYLDPRTGSR